MFIDLFCNLSREGKIIVHYIASIRKNLWLKIVDASLGGFLSIVFLVSFLPHELVYDITNLAANPRLNDFIFILSRISGNLLMGIGFGDILPVTSGMSWRDDYTVSNQLWLQVLINFGLLGSICIWFWIFSWIRLLRGWQKTHFIAVLLYAQLHNNFLMPSLMLSLLFAVLAERLVLIDKVFPLNGQKI
jgi:hypothetical protein